MTLAENRYRIVAIDVILALLCLSAWGAGYLFLFSKKLVLVRVLSLVAAGLSFIFLRRRQPKVYYLTLLYLLVYSVVTFVVSFPYLTFATDSGFIDFLIIGLFIYSLLTFATYDTTQSLKLFYWLSMAYIAAMFFMGCIEFSTGWHMPDSASLSIPIRSASGLSHNPNDYAVLVALALLYCLSYRRVFCTDSKLWVDALLVVLATTVFVMSACRTAIVAEALFLLFMFRKWVIRYWKIFLLVALGVVAVGIYLLVADNTLGYRFHLYSGAFSSLFDSYGLGFGIWGDRYYFSLQDNRDLLHGLTNVHSYLLQILLTSGLVPFLAYILLIAYIMRTMAHAGRNELWILPVFYLFLLFAPSSSLFLWGQYLLFVFMVSYACHVENVKKGALCR